ncbi:MAG: protein kinase, partial [Myxococcota bacterium]|nr:protein kinase [Myxococcota bacterium]
MEYPTLAQGRYEIRSRIGEGGMASVFHTFDTRLQMDRAVKILRPEHAFRKSVRERFEAEARTMVKLYHKHIVTVYDIVSYGRTVFMVMELLTGGSLMDRIHKFGPLHPKMAINAIIKMCEAIGHAHKHGVIHRDIKPHNMLISKDGL